MPRLGRALPLVLLAAGVGLLVASVATARRTDQAGEARRGGTVRMGFVPSGVDPATVPSSAYLHATQLTLFAFPDVDASPRLRLRPYGAQSFPRISRDGRTYTFTIRRGLRFSDGRPVLARNFQRQIERFLDPRVAGLGASIFADIEGADERRTGRARAVTGVRANGRTLTITLLRPAPDFLARLTSHWISAVPVDTPVVADGVAAPLHAAGPYYFREWVRHERALLVRNPYWRRDLIPWRPANADRFEFRRVRPAEGYGLIEADALDIGSWWTPANQAAALRRYGLNKGRLLRRRDNSVWYLAFNHDRPLFRDNPRLKRAINFAVDRAEIARRDPLWVERTDQTIPPILPGFRNWRIYPISGANLARARALARGNLRGGKAIMYTWAPSAVPWAPSVTEIVRYNLGQIGLEVEARSFEFFLDRIVNRDEPWDIALLGFFADYPDPSAFIRAFYSSGNIHYGNFEATLNFSRFRSRAFDRRIARASALAGERRFEEFARLDREIMARAAPIAPLFVDTPLVFVSKSTGCFSWHVYGFVNLVALCKR